MMMRLDEAALRRLWPQAPAELVAEVAAHSAEAFTRYGLGSALRVAHFMAQISHESGGGTITAENLSYASAARIAAVWPRRFTPASAAAYVHNPRKLADAVYNGRMGNAPGSSDGFDYRGRGLLQITGRDSYRAIGALVGLPLEERPELVAAPNVALAVAAAEFAKLGCLPFCDADNVEAVTRRVNGGYIGLASRKAWLVKWKAALADVKQSFQFNEDVNAGSDGGAPGAGPPAVEIPRGSDDHLPPGVEHPAPRNLANDPTAIAAGAGMVTTLASSLGGAVDSLKPFLADPHTLAAAAAVAVGVCVFILWQRHGHIGNDHV